MGKMRIELFNLDLDNIMDDFHLSEYYDGKRKHFMFTTLNVYEFLKIRENLVNYII